MSSFPLELTLQENNRSYNFYLDNSKLIKPNTISESFSEEESDSTNSTKSFHHQAQKHLKKREVNCKSYKKKGEGRTGEGEGEGGGG